MKVFNWTDRDWVWLTSVLLVAVILVSTIRLGDNQDIINYFSFAANAVSISLGLVAIGIAIAQNNSTQEINYRINAALQNIEQKVENVGITLNRIDPEEIKKGIQEGIKKGIGPAMDSLKDDITKSLQEYLPPNNESNKKAIQTITEKVDRKKDAIINEAVLAATKAVQLNMDPKVILNFINTVKALQQYIKAIDDLPSHLKATNELQSYLKATKDLYNCNKEK